MSVSAEHFAITNFVLKFKFQKKKDVILLHFAITNFVLKFPTDKQIKPEEYYFAITNIAKKAMNKGEKLPFCYNKFCIEI